MALHYGEAAYGNVGSGVRLDFTVIGRDVGLTSRIANLNRPLGQPVLMSRAFVERLRAGSADPVGAFALRGFKEPVEVFRPGPRGRRAMMRRRDDPDALEPRSGLPAAPACAGGASATCRCASSCRTSSRCWRSASA